VSINPGRLFCFGLGYSAEALARRWLQRGWDVAGTARDAARLAELEAMDIEAFPFDRDRRLPSGALEDVTHLLISVPPDAEGDPVLDMAETAIREALPELQWIGYLSTTGVYGDHDGALVDEAVPVNPNAARSRRRAEAEARWQALGAHIFRLAGIYGPGRSALDDVRAGTAKRIVKSGQVFSRIHVEDIATVLEASMNRPRPGAIYNVCDDEAAPSAEVVAHACALLGVEPPPEIPFEFAHLTPMALSFWADNKRVSNRLMHEELGVRLAYPSYREGLKSLLPE